MRRVILALICGVLIAGCTRQSLFVVLPNAEGGATGAITVDDGKTVTTLDRPYAAAESRSGSSEPVEETQGNISVIFRPALAAQPILPHHFRLYFIFGSDDLAPKSEMAYQMVLEDIKQRAVYQVEAVGHTDTVGDLRANQELSRKRAAAIRDKLVRAGVDSTAVSITGRGKLDPVVPTADQVPEPENRCVIVTVR
jgi:OmpA-OmpF porin, OOP family